MYYMLDVDFSGGTPALTLSVHLGIDSYVNRTDFTFPPYGERRTSGFSTGINHPVTLVKRVRWNKALCFFPWNGELRDASTLTRVSRTCFSQQAEITRESGVCQCPDRDSAAVYPKERLAR